MEAQDLKQHQWNQRLLLIIANDVNADEYRQQIAGLNKESQGCNERKLHVYQILPEQYTHNKLPVTDALDWKESDKLYKKYGTAEVDFKIILIGLDGTIKLEQEKPITAKDLFDKIDAMPMREDEMEND
jgi:hypothetical protein